MTISAPTEKGEKMAEYIEREAVRAKAVYMYGFGANKYVPLKAVENIPTADVAPVVHTSWFEMVESYHDTHTDEYWEEIYYNCLNCDYATGDKTPYCPNCGASCPIPDYQFSYSQEKIDIMLGTITKRW